MSALDLMTRPCSLIRRSPSGDLDRFGNPKHTELSVGTVCELQQRQRTEPGDQGELSDTTWTLFLPAGTNVNTGDTIVVDREYELIGDPWDVWDPGTQAVSHIEATVRRTRGADDEDAGPTDEELVVM